MDRFNVGLKLGRGLSWGLVLACAVTGNLAWAQAVIGQVDFARGAGFAQAEGQLPRTLGRGLPLSEGDRITTAEGAVAMVRLQDGTRMTVRPNSELVLQNYRYTASTTDVATPSNSMVLQLLRGGLRTLTGLVSKNSPGTARVVTPTATVGIRGTDFDMRLCGTDCAAETTRVQDVARPNTVQASAKVVSVDGAMSAVDGAGQRRVLVKGGSVYPGDTVETDATSRAVLAFRDDSRMTLGAQTRFRVDNFVYDPRNAGEGRFLASLLRGSLRALTGLIAKGNVRNVGFTTPTATVGIRGTGLDMDCTDTACNFYTWLGSIEVKPDPTVPGLSGLQVLESGQGLYVGPQGVRPLSVPTIDNLPRPDGVTVDNKALFLSDNGTESEPGLYVFVRDGHIEIVTPTETLQLGRGEAGFAGPNGRTDRPTGIPRFIDQDRTPLPGSSNPTLLSVLGEAGWTVSNQCR
jgi:hypothetical protein